MYHQLKTVSETNCYTTRKVQTTFFPAQKYVSQPTYKKERNADKKKSNVAQLTKKGKYAVSKNYLLKCSPIILSRLDKVIQTIKSDNLKKQ